MCVCICIHARPHTGRYDKSQADVLATLAREPAHFGALIGKGLNEYEQVR